MADPVADQIMASCGSMGALEAAPDLVRPLVVACVLRCLAQHVEAKGATAFTLTWDGGDIAGSVSDESGPAALDLDLTP
jgi:hypothetical protein